MKTQEQIEEALRAIQLACVAAAIEEKSRSPFDFLMAVQSTILWVLDSDDDKTKLVQRGINLGITGKQVEVR